MKNISDEKLRAYFLGKLPEPEAESLEIECATEAEIFEQAQTVERELTDDFLRGNLSAAERRLFETNYLITESRQKNLQIAGQLWKIAAEQRVQPVLAGASNASPTSFWQKIFGRRHAFQFAFGGLLFLLAFLGVAFYLLTLNVNKTEVAEVKDPIQSAKPVTPEIKTPDNLPVQDLTPEGQKPPPVSPDRNIQSKKPPKGVNIPPNDLPETKVASPTKVIEPVKPALLMTVKLLPGSLRAEGVEQSVVIAPTVKNLYLLLSPAGEPNNYKLYRVTVKTAENETVLTASNLKSLSFKIGAEKLQNRTYIISLEGKNKQNEYESIADYTLRVRR